jgi:hypothetical protein
MRFLSNQDLKLQKLDRSCIFGGHMIKVLNAEGDLDVKDTLDFIKVKNKSINFSKFNQF